MRYGSLVVLGPAGQDNNGRYLWRCQCDCGNIVVKVGHNLAAGDTKTCGDACHKAGELAPGYKHGMRHTRVYQMWANMKSRCYNQNNQFYPDYGGRGIYVCDEWRDNSKEFIDWALDHGYEDNLTIDRIDVNGPYAPWNCRFADRITQGNNNRHNRMITYNGETHTMAEWARISGIPYHRLRSRLNCLHWDVERALTTGIYE